MPACAESAQGSCSSRSRAPAGDESSEVVPWLPAAPPQAEPIVVSLAPPCDTDQLRGRLRVQGAGGALVGMAHPEVKFGTPELQARRGGILRYRIALTSRSKTPFAFSTCPVYEQRAFAHLREAYVLNCREAGAFAPRERKVFAMELKVPADAPLGRQPLIWMLGPDTYGHPWVPATILITP
jgi:hypothetical protein